MYKSLSIALRKPAAKAALRAVLLVGLAVVLWQKFRDVEFAATLDVTPRWSLLATVFFLVFLNLGAEAKKWSALVEEKALGFRRSLAGVLVGMCTGFFTPNRVGEAVGRWRYAPMGLRRKATALAVVGSGIQVGITAAGGVFGWLLYPRVPAWNPDAFNGYIPVVLGGIGLLLLGFLGARMVPIVRREWMRIRHALQGVGPRPLALGVFWAVVRYLVFSGQFVLALYAFGFEGALMEAWAGVGLVYFALACLPGSFFAELGVREMVATLVFAPFYSHPMNAALAAFCVWLINLALPIAYVAALRPKWIRALDRG